MTSSERLADWVRSKHEGQLIKRTNEPYFNHLIAVAEMAGTAITLGYEVGLCHDLLEKTTTRREELYEALITFGYLQTQALEIVSQTTALTNVFTKAAFPEMTKSDRKKMESIRLSTISPGAQTVKYADIIYNVEWMVKYDAVNAKKYSERKQILLSRIISGDPHLLRKAINAIQRNLSSFNEGH
jgi:(p)ppGpp synthase/HD superfamily hydrolase